MGNYMSCVACRRRKQARTETTSPLPPPRLRDPYRQSATSNMTHATTLTGASTIALQGLDGRTSITVFGKSHEDPLRCHPAQPPEENRGRRRERTLVDDEEVLTKRIGMVFMSDTENGSSKGSTRDGTPAEEIFEQVKTNDTVSTAVQTEEPPQDPVSAPEGASA